jgi:membrane-associated phospholipid phosphatase
MFPERAPLVWGIGAATGLTRVAVLAHWPSDVVAGIGLGVTVERLLRPIATARLGSSSGPAADFQPAGALADNPA